MNSDPRKITVKTLTELGLFLGISERTAARLIARGMPGQRGSYNLHDCAMWCKTNEWEPPCKRGDNDEILMTRGQWKDQELIEYIESL